MSGSIHDAALRAAAIRSARAAHDRQVAALAERAKADEEHRAVRELLREVDAVRAARRLRRRRIFEACCIVALALAGVAILVLGGAS